MQKLILEDIQTFLKELGSGFAFIGNEYKIKIGGTYNYIDLLLFNYQYKFLPLNETNHQFLLDIHFLSCL